MLKRRLLAATLILAALVANLSGMSFASQQESGESLEETSFFPETAQSVLFTEEAGETELREVTDDTESIGNTEKNEESVWDTVSEETETGGGKIFSFPEIKDSSLIKGLDFSSKRLIIASDKDIIVDRENLLSSYNGVYLMQYESEDEAKRAYVYYLDKAEMIDTDIEFSVSAGQAVDGEPALMTEDENPFSELAEAMDEPQKLKGNKLIALIDTGGDERVCVGRVSMIGDDPDDDNGHGDQMIAAINTMDSKAQILSIKALDRNGMGSASAIYAAIEYAISQKVKVINLSMSAYSRADNAIIRDIVEKAVDEGIVVVGAAGNSGKDVKYYIPGSIGKAVIAASCDHEGKILKTSNYGETVDYLVKSGSTSEAAAILSAWIAMNSSFDKYVSDIKELLGKNGIFYPVNGDETPETEEKEEESKEVYDSLIENYIRENADTKYSSAHKTELVGVLLVKNTMVDSETADDATIEDIMQSDEMDHFITQITGMTAIYDLSDESDYFLSFADTMHDDEKAHVIDAAMAKVNLRGEGFDDYHYDKKSGIVYIPKKRMMDGDKIVADALQMQLLQKVYTDDSFQVSSGFSAAVSDSEKRYEYEGEQDAFDFVTNVRVKKDLDLKSLVVTVNGIPVPESMYVYDPLTGVLNINSSSACIQNISVYSEGYDADQDIVAAAATYSSMSAVNTVTNRADCDIDAIDMGTSYKAKAQIMYKEDVNSKYPKVYYAESYGDTVKYILDKQNSIENNIKSLSSGELNFAINVGTIKNTSFPIDFAKVTKGSSNKIILAMDCSHIVSELGISVPSDLKKDPGTVQGRWYTRNIRIRALKKTSDYVVIGVITQMMNTQNGYGVFKLLVDDGPKSGLVIKKTIDKGDLAQFTNRVRINARFSLYKNVKVVDGEYVVDESSIVSVDGKTEWRIEAENDEYSDSETITGLSPGKYYLFETKMNNGCILNTKVYEVVLEEGKLCSTYKELDTGKLVTEVENRAYYGSFKVRKVDKNTREGLPGAIFKVEAWDWIEGYDHPKATGKPIAIWYFETDEDGYVVYDSEHFRSSVTLRDGTVLKSDAPCICGAQEIVNADGEWESGDVWCLPVCYIKVNEVEAPENYKLSEPEGRWFRISTLDNFTNVTGLPYEVGGGFEKGLCPSLIEADQPKMIAEINAGSSEMNSLEHSANFGAYIIRTDVTVTGNSAKYHKDVPTWSDEPENSYIQITKTTDSAYTSLVQGNNNYSLEGAEFEIYKADKSTKLCSSATASNGKTPVLKLNSPAGASVWVKEVKAPRGYQLPSGDEAWTEIKTTAENASIDKPATKYIANRPLYAPADWYIQKIASGTTKGLNKAQFEFKFTGGDAVRIWKVESKNTDPGKKDGYIRLHQNYSLKDANNQFFTVNGEAVIPLGKVELKETKAPIGFALDTKTYTGKVIQDGNSAKFSWETADGNLNIVKQEFSNEYYNVDIQIHKADYDKSLREGEGDVDLSGFVFEVRRGNKYDEESLSAMGQIPQKRYKKGELICEITTDENGYARTTGKALQIGFDYVITEIGSKDGYYLTDGAPRKISVVESLENIKSNDGKLLDAISPEPEDDWKNKVWRVGAELKKSDRDTLAYTPQGDASLAGISFAVVNRSLYSAVVNKVTYDPGQVVSILTTDEAGHAELPETTLPYGSYEIIELREDSAIAPGDVYEKATDKYGSSIYANRDHSYLYDDYRETKVIHGEAIVMDYKTDNAVTRGGFELHKVDLETMISYALGGASLEGIEFTLVNISKESVFIKNGIYPEGHLYAPGDVIHDEEGNQVWTTDNSGCISSNENYLPYGTYKLTETKTNDSYLKTDTIDHSFKIREEGLIVGKVEGGKIRTREQAEKGELVVADQVIRSDFSFRKKDENGRNLAHTPWEIKNIVTGETHYILTDVNGEYCSRTDSTSYSDGQDSNYAKYAPHSLNTNAYDDILSPYAESGEVIPQSLIDGLAEKYKDRAGTWFGLSQDVLEGADGTMAEADDSLGAFPYGWYTIRELPTEKTKNHTMVDDEFFVQRNNYLIDYGTIDNEPVTLKTMAADFFGGGHSGMVSEQARIRDKVYYTGLDTAATYKLVAELHAVTGSEDRYKDGGIITDADGRKLIGEKVFSPESRDGYINTDIELNSSKFTVGGKEFSDGRTVVFEYLYEIKEDGSEKFIRAHIDPGDEDQTITYPHIGTKARDGKTGLQMSNADTEIIVEDVIEYRNLSPMKYYTFSGTLMDKESGEPALDADGNRIMAETRELIKSANGTVTVSFKFNGSTLGGKTLVAFEEASDGSSYISHADINDEEQTIYIPRISTQARDSITKEHMGIAGGNFVDTVSYTNLIPGYEYRMHCELIEKETGESTGLTGETIFVAKADGDKTCANGSVDISIDLSERFTPETLEGMSLVAFETLYVRNGSGEDGKPNEDTVVAEHKNIEDEGQTIHYPQIRTMAVSGDTGTKETQAGSKTRIMDSVYYRNLVPGKRYKLEGTLMSKNTGKALRDANGNASGSSLEFVPEESEGMVEMSFTSDTSSLAGDSVVVFERLYLMDRENPENNPAPIAKHEDIKDEDQSVNIIDIKTKAKDKKSGTQKVTIGKIVKIVDTVSFSGLTPGKEYRIAGTLMDKSTKKPLEVSGKTVTAEKIFTAKESKGTVDVTFKLNSKGLRGKNIVVFEKLYDGDTEIARHEDIRDKDQTLKVPKSPTSGERTPSSGTTPTPTVKNSSPAVKTGDNMNIAVLSGILISAAAILGLLFKRRRRWENT